MRTYYPVRHANGLPDQRYSVRLEWSGHAEPHYVARFCGEFLGSSRFLASAMVHGIGAAAERRGNPVIVERLE